jgi:hypothetical protein
MIQLNQNIQDLQKFNITVKELPFLSNELKVGQVIRAKVVEIMDNELLLLINGQKLLAQSSLNLNINDLLFLKVQSIKPSIVLQFYGIETSSSKDPGSELLRMFNLDKNILNQVILTSLMKYSQPVSKTEIQSILNIFNTVLLKIARVEKGIDKDVEIKNTLEILKSLNIPIEEENLVNSIVFLKSNNIPVNTLTILKTLLFLSNKQDIGSDLNQLISLLKGTSEMPKKLFEKIKLLIPNGASSEKIDVEKTINNLGLDYEKKVAELLKGKKPNELNIQGSLKGTLLELEEFIRNNPRIENAEKLHILATKILNNIELQQLINKNDNALNKNWILQIPIPMGNTFKTVELKVSKRKDSNKSYNQPNTSFNLKIEMSNLGKVNTSGNVYKNNLSCFFGLEKKEYCEIFEKEFDFLKTKFQELGYIVSNIKAEYTPDVTIDFVDNFKKSQNQTALDLKV